MAAVLEKQDAAAKNGSAVDEQIAQATSRIRTHGLAFGGLVLVGLVLIYATTMICLDRYIVLPEWLRQVALLGFCTTLAAVAYLTILSPLRKRINPLYAAKQVERTIDDAKNSVTGYVDAQQKGTLNATVKAALASRAAKSVAEADVNKAVDHRSLIYLGAVSVVFLLALVVLFFVFRPAQFSSLMGRTFVPFSSAPLVTQTQLLIVKPDPLEPTFTRGQSITIAVQVVGKVPNPDGPNKVRLLIRHNPNDPNYDELPMVRGDTSRDWELRVPDHLTPNGFWYKVAGGDFETPEYRVTVRSLPLFTEFQANYEYPAYLRLKPNTTNDALIHAYRGTTVTLIARTNRDVRDGLMQIEPSNARVAGTPVPGKPDSLQFVFKVTEPSKYKLTFTAANGERTADPFQSAITVETDAAPQVVINKPEDDEIPLPANGQLKVDGKVGDDIGIDTVTLKMKLVEPVERPLPDVPYMNGTVTSFKRDKDKSWPTDLDYKGSVDFAKLTKDAAGNKIELTQDMVIEYWLEATDNCNEPKANVGRSQPKRVRLTAPKVDEVDKKDLDEKKDQRKDEEKKHTDQQKQKLDKEARPEKKNGQPDKKDGKQEDGKKEDGKSGEKGDNQTKPGGEGMGDPMKPKTPETAPDPKTPQDKNLDETAKSFEKELEDKKNKELEDKKNGGAAKNNPTPEEDRTDPGNTKPQPMDGGMKGMDPSEPKPEPKKPDPNNPADPMNKPDAAPSTTKPEPKAKEPDEQPAAPKPEDKKSEPMPGQQGGPSESRNDPKGAPPNADKNPPKEQPPASKDPNQKQDPNSGSTAKPAGEKKDGEPGGMPNPADKKDPAAEAGTQSKPMPQDPKGGDKPAPQPKEPPAGAKLPPDESGDGKPASAPPAGGAKPAPKEPMPKGDGEGADPKPKPSEGANDPKPNGTGAAETKPDEKAPPMGGKSVDKGTDKPTPNEDKGGKPGASGDAPKKLDEKELKELEQAAKDLNSPDPNKKADAQKRLDKAIGEGKRKELEQLDKDLKSDDKAKRDAAEKKIEDIKKQMGEGKPGDKGNPGASGDAPKRKPDEKELKELEEAANNLNSPDPKKQKDAQDKLDKAIGEDKRKELEKLDKDLKSDDKATRDAAQKKVDDIKKEMGEGKQGDKQPAKQDGPKLDEKQMKELKDAVNDLQSGDEKKKADAQKKLDKAIGEDKRKELEKLDKDLKSDDKATRDAAQKKIDDIKKEMDKQNAKKDGKENPMGKGKEPSPEELADLMKKAQDLQSKDEKTKQQAQKDLDDKIGKENREKLEEMMKDQKPGDPEQEKKTKEQLEKMAKNPPPPKDDIKPGSPGSSPPANAPMDADAKNRLKSLELNLKDFEKEENRKLLQSKKGWTDAEYEKFLDGYRKRVEDAKKDVDAGPKLPTGPTDTTPPMFTPGRGDKVEGTPGATGGPASAGGGPTAAPPGFENARDKFLKALQKKP